MPVATELSTRRLVSGINYRERLPPLYQYTTEMSPESLLIRLVLECLILRKLSSFINEDRSSR